MLQYIVCYLFGSFYLMCHCIFLLHLLGLLLFQLHSLFTFIVRLVSCPPYIIFYCLISCLIWIVCSWFYHVFVTGIVVVPLPFTTSIVTPVKSTSSPYLVAFVGLCVYIDICYCVCYCVCVWYFYCCSIFCVFYIRTSWCS